MGVEQLVDQPGGLHLVELLDPLAEALAGEVVDLVLVERVLVDELQDEFLLLVAAAPAVGPLRRVAPGSVGRRSMKA